MGRSVASTVLGAVVALALTVSFAAAAPPDVSTLVLQPSQVGKGYTIQRPAGGVGLGVPTLDLCRIAYPSEKLRQARVQVVYVPATSAVPAVSNEVVAYAPGGAAQALREVAAAPGRCPRKPVLEDGATVTYRVTRAAGTGLPRGAVVVVAQVVARSNGQVRRLDATLVYFRKGDTLSAVYVYGGTPAGRTALARSASAASAAKLAQSVGGQAA